MLEKLKDEIRSVFKKVDVCPRCNNHLEIDIKRRLIECPSCGLTIEIDSKLNNAKRWLVVATSYAVILACACLLFALT